MDKVAFRHFEITPLRRDILAAARHRQSQLTKPVGSLGRMENVAVQLSGIQKKPHQMPEKQNA